MPHNSRRQTKVHVLLTEARSRWWQHVGRTGLPAHLWMRGYARISDRYYHGQELCDLVHAKCVAATVEQSVLLLRELIPTLDGGWAMVSEFPDGHILAATDRMRTIPLFWTTASTELVISDSAIACAHFAKQTKIDDVTALEFVLAGYVSGHETLFEGVHQIQCGEIIECDTGDGVQVATDRYYRFYPTEKSDRCEADLERELVNVLDDIFEAFARSLNGESIVVPLSGGLDSRLVVTMLHRHHVPNVFCYTFGNPNSDEARISKNVANAIGYEWACAEYSQNTWKTWFADPSFLDYWEFACKGCSRPCSMDFPAINSLIETKRIEPSGTIVFPGHTGDMISGGHIPATYYDFYKNPRSLERHLLEKHFVLWPISYKDFSGPLLSPVLDKVLARSEPPPRWIRDPTAAAEMWNAESRQPMYIINAVRCYEFSGMRWRTLWDYLLMDFFLKVPVELRFGQRLYVNAVRDHLLRGNLQPLADIPLAGHGDWSSRRGLNRRMTQRRKFVRSIRRLIRATLMMAQRRAIRSCYRQQAPDAAQLSGIGIGDVDSTLHDALQFRDTIDYLPLSVREFLNPFLTYRVSDVSWWPLISALALGHVARSVQVNSSKTIN